jgi:hypothetical protein
MLSTFGRSPMYFSPRNGACSGKVNKGSSTLLSRDARYCKDSVENFVRRADPSKSTDCDLGEHQEITDLVRRWHVAQGRNS